MIRRLLTGLTGLAVLTLGLLGLPAFLITAHQQLADLMPSLGDLPSALLAPGDGGLFILTLFGIGWVCWIVFLLAFLIEVISRARGVRTPRLGPFLPQRTAAWAITAVTLLASLSPSGGSPAHTPAPAVGATASTETAGPTHHATGAPLGGEAQPRATSTAHRATGAAQAKTQAMPWRNYRVKRGDTLWDIAGRKLADPTQWPTIAKASDDIPQPHGRQLEDPDLIVTGWTLRIPTAEDVGTGPATQDQPPAGSPSSVETEPPTADPEAPLPETPLRPHRDETGSSSARGTSAIAPNDPRPPTTPLRPEPTAASSARSAAGSTTQAAPLVGSTPLNPATHSPVTADVTDEAVLVLPDWVRHPLTPARFADAPQQTRMQVLAALAERRGWSGSPDE